MNAARALRARTALVGVGTAGALPGGQRSAAGEGGAALLHGAHHVAAHAVAVLAGRGTRDPGTVRVHVAAVVAGHGARGRRQDQARASAGAGRRRPLRTDRQLVRVFCGKRNDQAVLSSKPRFRNITDK